MTGLKFQLTLAHSPDPDDVFMWWPITGMIEPPRPAADPREIAPAKVLSPPEIDTGRFRFTPIAADIAVLNRRAEDCGDFDITAVSMFAWLQPRVRDRYALTSFGGSFGVGYGPKLVVRAGSTSGNAHQPASAVCYAGEVDRANAAAAARAADAFRPALPDNPQIAVPGIRTTAFLVLSMILGKGAFRHVEMPFDQIADAVARAEHPDDAQGDCAVVAPPFRAVASGPNIGQKPDATKTMKSPRIDAGLLIHQSQLTFAEQGLEVLCDVGAWWNERTGLPLPLGGNAVRRDLDARFGPDSTREVAGLLHRSILYALEHRDRSIDYCMKFAPELNRDQAERYINMYVNDLTVDAGTPGAVAVQRLLDEAVTLGMCPSSEKVEFLRP